MKRFLSFWMLFCLALFSIQAFANYGNHGDRGNRGELGNLNNTANFVYRGDQQQHQVKVKEVIRRTEFRMVNVPATCQRQVPHMVRKCHDVRTMEQRCHRTQPQRVCRQIMKQVCKVRPGKRVCKVNRRGRRVCKVRPGRRVCRQVPRKVCNVRPGRRVCRQVPVMKRVCRNIRRMRVENYACTRQERRSFEVIVSKTKAIASFTFPMRKFPMPVRRRMGRHNKNRGLYKYVGRDLSRGRMPRRPMFRMNVEFTAELFEGKLRVTATDLSGQKFVVLATREQTVNTNRRGVTVIRANFNVKFIKSRMLVNRPAYRHLAQGIKKMVVRPNGMLVLRTGLIQAPQKTKLRLVVKKHGQIIAKRVLFTEDLMISSDRRSRRGRRGMGRHNMGSVIKANLRNLLRLPHLRGEGINVKAVLMVKHGMFKVLNMKELPELKAVRAEFFNL